MKRSQKNRSTSTAATPPQTLGSSAHGASPEETAAIVAAIERFKRATAPASPPAHGGPDPWLRAAILEGVAREGGDGLRGDLPDPWITDLPDPWINP
jgi:hypothetical protein